MLYRLRNSGNLESILRGWSFSPLPSDRSLRDSRHPPSHVFKDWAGQSAAPSKSRVQQMILGDRTDSESPLSHHYPQRCNESWTTVTSDRLLVEHLLALYFCWEYPICATVSKKHFLEDFRRGYSRYCSPLLVNALLALACRFSDRPSIRRNKDDGTTAGDNFYAEAWKLFREEHDHHVITTVQALGIMSIREASCGRISQSSFLSGESMRIAIEMGLHDHDHATFWGAFTLNEYRTITSPFYVSSQCD
jgi:hypothetical protein